MRVLRKMLPIYALTLLLVWAAARAASAGLQAYSVMAESEVQEVLPLVVLDPGHGGEDGGAVSANGVRESVLNLEISLRLRDLLRFLGWKVEMTRESDVSIYSAEAATISEKKISDLKNRAALANREQNAILISIHQNMFSESKYRGAQVFYAGSGGGKALAEQLQGLLGSCLDPNNHRQVKESRTVYLLTHAHCPAVLVECGFLSNPQEEQLLQDPAYQKKLAAVIAAGLSEAVPLRNIY